MGRERIISLGSAEETRACGKHFGLHLWPNAILALSGDLGAGKTTFVQGIGEGLQIAGPILSPTFIYLNVYTEGARPLFHFDLYRLRNETDFLSLGFQEYFEIQGICAIEWPERIWPLLPHPFVSLRLIQTDRGRDLFVKIEGASSIEDDLLHFLDIYETHQ